MANIGRLKFYGLEKRSGRMEEEKWARKNR